jgi:hypothetical protein
VVIKFRYMLKGAHIHTAVFTGPDKDHLGLSGKLVFTKDDWEGFRAHRAARLLNGEKGEGVYFEEWREKHWGPAEGIMQELEGPSYETTDRGSV